MAYIRRKSHEVNIGRLKLGGDNPIRVQSMNNTSTMDTQGSVNQVLRIAEAGGELVRLTTQGVREAENMRLIREGVRAAGCNVPLVADVHFNPRVADVAALAQREGQIAELTKAVAQKEGDRARAEQELAARDAEVRQLQTEIERFKDEVSKLKREMEDRQAPHAREWSTEVVEPEIVTDEMPPPVARQAFDFGNASALADLERRAQQELARMGPLHAKKFFKIKK